MASMSREEIAARRAEIKARMDEIDNEYQGRTLPEEQAHEFRTLDEEDNELQELDAELEFRHQRLQAKAASPAHREDGATFHTRREQVTDIWDVSEARARSRSDDEFASLLHDNAMRAVERMHFAHEDANREDTQGHLERLVHQLEKQPGEEGRKFARHILTVGSPTYERAFGKTMLGQHLTQDEQRAMSLTGASGGFAVPVTMDPTILPTSNGAINPWRAVSRVRQITGNTWNGVTAGAVVASRDAEFEEVSDDSPALAQPTATVTKAEAFVPFSIEVGMDWASIQSDLAALIQDAKDAEEATAFCTGAGTGVNPQGVLTGATNTVAAGTAAFTVPNAYALLEALPPRFRPNGVFVASLAQYNRIRQLDTAGGASLWVQNLTQGVGNQADGNVGATFLGKPAYESSVMTSALTAGSKIMVFGDFNYYLIVDKIGMTVEIIPHLFGTTNQRPIGMRGLLAYWRNTGKVLSAAAFRVLQTT